MTPREKKIALFVGAAVGLFALDQYVLEPYFGRLGTADDRIAQHQTEISDNNTVLQNRLRASRRWKEVAAGTIRNDYTAAESQLLNRVEDCAGRAGLQIGSNKSDKAEKEKGYERVSVKYEANGTMRQIARFLYEIQNTDIPVRVNDMAISSRKDGTDDLKLSVTLATIYQSPTPQKLAAANAFDGGLR